MSGFWEKALGTPAAAPAAPAQTPGSVPGQQPWFRQPLIPQQPQQPVVHDQVQPLHTQEPPAPTTKARSARSDERCPDCGSGNYFKPDGMHNAMTQCYECGYNPRFSQSAGGVSGGAQGSGPSAPARQVSTANNYNPSQIVATVQ